VPGQLTSANAVSATLVQLATGAGIAVGALLLRLFESDSLLSSGLAPYCQPDRTAAAWPPTVARSCRLRC
jgi:hypothetical protein